VVGLEDGEGAGKGRVFGMEQYLEGYATLEQAEDNILQRQAPLFPDTLHHGHCLCKEQVPSVSVFLDEREDQVAR
jgi:hypothetical protein